jgi:hypothetical protein
MNTHAVRNARLDEAPRQGDVLDNVNGVKMDDIRAPRQQRFSQFPLEVSEQQAVPRPSSRSDRRRRAAAPGFVVGSQHMHVTAVPREHSHQLTGVREGIGEAIDDLLHPVGALTAKRLIDDVGDPEGFQDANRTGSHRRR